MWHCIIFHSSTMFSLWNNRNILVNWSISALLWLKSSAPSQNNAMAGVSWAREGIKLREAGKWPQSSWCLFLGYSIRIYPELSWTFKTFGVIFICVVCMCLFVVYISLSHLANVPCRSILSFKLGIFPKPAQWAALFKTCFATCTKQLRFLEMDGQNWRERKR